MSKVIIEIGVGAIIDFYRTMGRHGFFKDSIFYFLRKDFIK